MIGENRLSYLCNVHFRETRTIVKAEMCSKIFVIVCLLSVGPAKPWLSLDLHLDNRPKVSKAFKILSFCQILFLICFQASGKPRKESQGIYCS